MTSMRNGLISSATESRKIYTRNVVAHNGITRNFPEMLKEDSEYVRVASAEVRNESLNSQAESTIEVINKEKALESISRKGKCCLEVISNTENTMVRNDILPLCRRKTKIQETSLSGSSSHHASDVTIMDEDKLKEIKDSYNQRSLSQMSSTYILPNLIPRLYLTNEDGSFIEIIVDKARMLDSIVAYITDVNQQGVV